MSRGAVVRRVAVGLGVVVLVAAVVASVVVVTAVRDSLPRSTGEVALPGLEADVTVLRDGSGIPHLYGDRLTDLARAQGYVHAQERFFEMDLRRHVAAGRLAELVGESGVESDRAIRTMGWRRVAEAELPTLDSRTRQMFQAYADGVNAYVGSHSPGELSLEYTVLGLRLPLGGIEDWTPVDSLTWLKAMAWDLRGNYDNELARARLTGRLPPKQIAQLYPAYDLEANPPILSSEEWSPSVDGAGGIAGRAADDDTARTRSPAAAEAYAAAHRALAAVPELVGNGEGVGSNSWVVSGSRTTTGAPLLANDPHLKVGQPGVWIQNGLSCRRVGPECPMAVSGFSFAGVPGVVIGHNQQIAWGFTNLAPDVTDFYLERVVGDTYLRDGEWIPVTSREEVIRVAGGPDVRIPVRTTVHGPVLSDVLAPVADAGARAPTADEDDDSQTYAVSLSWTALRPGRTAEAIVGINLATNFGEFREAARDFAVPAQNLVYADRAGRIGYQAPGLVPIRGAALPRTQPGYWPAPGWDSAYDWQGFVPFEQLPWALDPDDGVIVAANQAVTASRTPFLTSEWDHGWRASRIADRLGELGQVSPDDMRAIQRDTRDEFADVLVPALLAVPLDSGVGTGAEADVAFTEEARSLLRRWDRTMPADDSDASAGAAYYNAVWRSLCSLIFDDELPGDLTTDGGARDRAAVQRLLKDPASPWWDDKLTPNVTEGKDAILRRALVAARLDLTRELGKDPSKWQWGKLHRLTLDHPVMSGDDVPAPVRALFTDGPHQVPGGSAVVNANGWVASEGFAVSTAPSMRMVVDLGDLERSTWINQTGVSGHPWDDHYSDQVADWLAGRQRPWPFSEAAVRATDPDQLVLRSAPSD
ncbi:MAG: penicillin acylase family protein [Dermatophilaceae bacterium]